MDAELKIVGAIVIGIMFLANTGVGIWIYRIMKASEETISTKENVKLLEIKLLSAEDTERKDKQELLDRLNFEREERLKMTYSLKQMEKESTSLHTKSDKMFDEFIQTTQKFQNIATKLNSTMEHLNSHISGMQTDIKEIRQEVQKRIS